MSWPGVTLTRRRRIAVVTTARSDYGIWRPVLTALCAEPALELALIAGGSHLDPAFGRTETAIEADGFAIAARVPFLPAADSRLATAQAMGVALSGFADAFAATGADMVMVLGDRWETLAAASAASVMGLPLGHVHGGELTLGAMDDCFRHAITKLAHLHFTATPEYAARIRQLGEEPWRVIVSGAPGLDNLRDLTLPDRATLSARLGFALPEHFWLTTFHPVTTELDATAAQVADLLAALDDNGMPVLFTYAGADPGGRAINAAIDAHCAARPQCRVMPSLGLENYFAAMALAAGMVGNSSSGIIEAASFALPVVNIGRRQDGRARGANVIDCGHARADIGAALDRALSADFTASLSGLTNLYDQGGAAGIIVNALRDVALDARLLAKGFVDRPEGTP